MTMCSLISLICHNNGSAGPLLRCCRFLACSGVGGSSHCPCFFRRHTRLSCRVEWRQCSISVDGHALPPLPWAILRYVRRRSSSNGKKTWQQRARLASQALGQGDEQAGACSMFSLQVVRRRNISQFKVESQQWRRTQLNCHPKGNIATSSFLGIDIVIYNIVYIYTHPFKFLVVWRSCFNL